MLLKWTKANLVASGGQDSRNLSVTLSRLITTLLRKP